MKQDFGDRSRTDSRGLVGTARYMATELARLFRAHDDGRREDAIEACLAVDELQFPTLDSDDVELAATAFVDALWAKDDIEFEYLHDGEIDREGLQEADYGRVSAKLRERAAIIGADPAYATTKAKAWRRHKAGGDYWTPFQQSQVYELRAALNDPTYPNKTRAGQSGPGPESVRYVLAFELHDMHTDHHWQQGVDVMVPYFRYILRNHADNSNTNSYELD